jgi:hypothetical protein
LSTNKPGSPNNQGTTREGSRLPWSILALAIVGFLLALYIGTQVVGVLVGILFPPSPPLPPNVVLITHQSIEHGVDDWVYNANLTTCNVIAFYQSIGADCEVPPESCQVETTLSSATCADEMKFSIFAMRWDVTISPGEDAEHSDLHLSREVFWTGEVPPREFPLPESNEMGNN